MEGHSKVWLPMWPKRGFKWLHCAMSVQVLFKFCIGFISVVRPACKRTIAYHGRIPYHSMPETCSIKVSH